jgi:hypothetical protein
VRRFFTPGWLLRHAIAVVLVAGCLGMGWWQIVRARGGNALSWGYAVEWPVFALFVLFVWGREVRATLRGGYVEPAPPRSEVPEDLRIEVPVRRTAGAAEDDAQTSEYNRYLAWLAAHPEAKPRDYRG